MHGIRTNILTDTHKHVRTYINMYVQIHANEHVLIHECNMYICTHVLTCTCTHTHAIVRTCIYVDFTL